jgi:hypothetical protein
LVSKCEEVSNDAISNLIYFFQHLAAQCTGKKSQLSTEFKTILDLFLVDYLILLGNPDFPIVEYSLIKTCVFFASKLDGKELALKTTSLEFLGSLVKVLEKQFIVDSTFNSILPIDFNVSAGSFDMYCDLFMTMYCGGDSDEFVFASFVTRISKSSNIIILNQFIDFAKAVTRPGVSTHDILKVHMNLSQSIQNLISKHIDSPNISIRTKCLKVLQEVYTSAALPLNSPIIDSLVDPSASVRDVALEIIGRCVISHAGQLRALFPIICERITV